MEIYLILPMELILVLTLGDIMISDESLAWINSLNKFYKSGDKKDLPANADINNTYVFDALKKWKLIKNKKYKYIKKE